MFCNLHPSVHVFQLRTTPRNLFHFAFVEGNSSRIWNITKFGGLIEITIIWFFFGEEENNWYLRSKLTENSCCALRISCAFSACFAKCTLCTTSLTFFLGATHVAKGFHRSYIALKGENRGSLWMYCFLFLSWRCFTARGIQCEFCWLSIEFRMMIGESDTLTLFFFSFSSSTRIVKVKFLLLERYSLFESFRESICEFNLINELSLKIFSRLFSNLAIIIVWKSRVCIKTVRNKKKMKWKVYLEHGNRCDCSFGDGVLLAKRTRL